MKGLAKAPEVKKVKKVKKEEEEEETEEQRTHRLAVARRKRTSTIARPRDWKRKGHAYRLVYYGKKKKTSGGLVKKDIIKNKRGRCVSKKRSMLAKKTFKANHLDLWNKAFMRQREEMGLTGFVPISRNGPTGIYQKTVEEWAKAKIARLNVALKQAGSNMTIGVQPRVQSSSRSSAAPEVRGVPWPFN